VSEAQRVGQPGYRLANAFFWSIPLPPACNRLMVRTGHRRVRLIPSILIAFLLPPQRLPDLPTAEDLKRAVSFKAEDRIVATHYFYWYRWPDQHFFDDANHRDSGLRHWFVDPKSVSYESVAWHKRQMEDMIAAGIDVALPVYWGAPNNYDKADIAFSVRGLPPLVQAIDELTKEGKKPPRVGMFYDTSTLLGEHALAPGDPRRKLPPQNRGFSVESRAEPKPPWRIPNVDLRTDEGKDIFYRTIRDFFCLVPPRHWACLDGRPIVQLYEAGFAAGHDQTLVMYVTERFAKDFAGRKPLIIAGPSWSLDTGAATGWGAALGGPILGKGGIVQIGPGYDDSPVPGRTTPVRERLGGGFYSASWLIALQAKPRLVIVETWNELHEGTGICETLEDGRFYIDLNRKYADLLKAGKTPPEGEWAATVKMLLNSPSSNRDGREHASGASVATQTGSGKLDERGLRLVRDVADGACSVESAGGIAAIRTKPGAQTHRYLYFDIADAYYYDHRGSLTLTFDYFDEGTNEIVVQYDSIDEAATLGGRYKDHPQRIRRGDTKQWKSAKITLPEARCADRQNGGADFRLLSMNSDMAVSRVEVSKLPPDLLK
jgi:hypothetical protein